MLVCGIDSGARATKVVLLDGSRNQVSGADVPTGSAAGESADQALRAALEAAGALRADVSFTTATGYGRGSVKADGSLTEITCHARGTLFRFEGARTVLDVGGQDSKFISIDEAGDVVDFTMNDRCAAGTGRFLEVISDILGVRVEDLSALAARSNSPAPIASVCVVFTESEVVSLISKGARREDIAAGVLESMAARMRGVMGHLVPRTPAVFVGGAARNAAFADALSRQLGMELVVPEEPHLTGALGAALFSLEKAGVSDIQGA